MATKGSAISADTLKEILSVLKKNMSWMTNNEIVEKALDNMMKTDTQMDDDEKKALESVVTTCQKIGKANDLATKAVNTLVGHIKALLRVFHVVQKLDLETVTPAIKFYMEKLEKDVLPELKVAHDGVEEAVKAQMEMKCQLKELEDGLERKIAELDQEKGEAVLGAREVAYGGAAGATIGVAAIVAALNFWNPIGWAAIAAGSAITFGVAAGVVEGGKVPKLKKVYKSTMGEVKRSMEGLDSLIKQTGEFQAQLMEKTVLLEESEDLGGLILGGTEGLILEFKESLESLEASCHDYLKGDESTPKQLMW